MARGCLTPQDMCLNLRFGVFKASIMSKESPEAVRLPIAAHLAELWPCAQKQAQFSAHRMRSMLSGRTRSLRHHGPPQSRGTTSKVIMMASHQFGVARRRRTRTRLSRASSIVGTADLDQHRPTPAAGRVECARRPTLLEKAMLLNFQAACTPKRMFASVGRPHEQNNPGSFAATSSPPK